MCHFEFIPTPIDRMDFYSTKFHCNMMAKRDDLFQVAGGGSKARMLQYILAGGRNYDVLVTAGNPNSNFNRACALMCAKLKIPMHLIEYAESETQFEKSLNYKICTLAGVKKTDVQKKRSMIQ